MVYSTPFTQDDSATSKPALAHASRSAASSASGAAEGATLTSAAPTVTSAETTPSTLRTALETASTHATQPMDGIARRTTPALEAAAGA